jgi:hypothetical protein
LKIKSPMIDFMLKEWLLIFSGVGLLLTSIYVRHFPVYSIQQLQVLFILFILFVAVKGLKLGGILLKIGQYIENGEAAVCK